MVSDKHCACSSTSAIASGIEQLAQICFTQQFAQLVLIDSERLCASLGKRSVTVIQEIRDVAKQQGRSKGRGLSCLDHMHAELPLFFLLEAFRPAQDMSKISRRHSRYASSSRGNEGYREATLSRSYDRFRNCQSGER